MSWESFRAEATVVFDFFPKETSSGKLPLRAGEHVVIEEKSGDWFFGYVQDEVDRQGVFHSKFVEVLMDERVEATLSGQESELDIKTQPVPVLDTQYYF